MDFITNIVNFILDLGAATMIPVILLVFSLLLGQKFGKSFRAAMMVGIGFTGVGLVIGLLMGSVGAAAQKMIENQGLNLDIIDVGWPVAAAITWAAPIAVVLIPVIFIFNMILLALNLTKTMDVDIWNYWHLIFPGAIIYSMTENLLLAIFLSLVNTFVIFKLADWTQPAVEHELGLPGVSLPHGETVNFAPLTYALNKIWDKIPGFRDINITSDTLKDKLGIMGEPLVIGYVLGIGMGFLAGYEVSKIMQLGVEMAAVMIILPRMVAMLMEGLMPISEGAKEFIQKKFPGKDVFIGLDAAVATGHSSIITVALIMIPITILLAAILPYNRMLPFADLAVLPFTVIWSVLASRGNIFRGIINAIISMCIVFFIATNLGALTTQLAQSVGFPFPEGATMVSGIDMSCHLTLWIMVKLINFSDTSGFIAGLIGLGIYALAWYWTRNDIRKTYASK